MMRTILVAAAIAVSAPAAAGTPYQPPRTADGRPSLEGLWTGASWTPLERPKDFKALAATPEEARAFESRVAGTGGVDIPPGADPVGQGQSEFPEAGSGLARIRGEIRSSHIVEPADGQLPWTAEGKSLRRRRSYDGPEARPDNERCMASSSTGAPTLPAEDANVLQILQAPGHVVILTERYHDARIVRMDAAPGPLRSWLGESVGRWEGDTLVVRTTNYREGVFGHGDDVALSGRSTVEERFTRIAADQILYGFTVTDPVLYSRPWRGEIVLRPSPGRWFPYDCHEGNYSIVNVLQAARLGLQPAPKPAAADAAPQPQPLGPQGPSGGGGSTNSGTASSPNR